MTITELISAFEDLRAEHGDVEICVPALDEYGTADGTYCDPVFEPTAPEDGFNGYVMWG